MKQITILGALMLAACATTPAGLLDTDVEETVESTKTAASFATCVAENMSGAALRNDGDRYWVLVEIYDIPRMRYDFRPTENGSIVEVRSTALGGAATKELKRCAS
ncbi:MAG: hypothetical protein AAFY81_06920 [Pseudomonadota bacterium]